METRLRKLKATKRWKLADGKPLSVKYRLTDIALEKLQIFYGFAIRINTNSVASIKQAVWATYFTCAFK